MKVTLNSTNTEHYPSAEKTIILIPRKNEILITTEQGKEIASLSIQIMDKDISNEIEKNKVGPSNSFWLTFSTKSSDVDPRCADVYEEND